MASSGRRFAPFVLAAVALIAQPPGWLDGLPGEGRIACGSAGRLLSDPGATLAAPDVPKPAYLTPICPGPFGLNVTRIADDPGRPLLLPDARGTWGADARHHYSKDQPWSADGRLLALQNSGSPHQLFVDGETYAPRLGRCRDYAYGDDRWHPAHQRPRPRPDVVRRGYLHHDTPLDAAVPGRRPGDG